MNIRPSSEWMNNEVQIVDEAKIKEPVVYTIEVKEDFPKESVLLVMSDEDNFFETEPDLFHTELVPESILKPMPSMPKDKIKTETIHYEQPSLLLQHEPITKSSTIQQDFFGGSELQIYLKKLKSEGFDAFTKQAQADRVYVLGSIQLGTELARIAPKKNSFTFLKDGNEHTGNEPAWYVDFDLELDMKVSKKEKIEVVEVKKDQVQTSLFHDEVDHMTTLILEMRSLGFEVIDYRHKSQTIYVIGNQKLEKPLMTYNIHGLTFHLLPKGNKTTGFRSAWYAKVKD